MEIRKLHELFMKSCGVCTDTRKIEKDSIFFALRGENFNGNSFAGKAIESGAMYAVMDDKELYDKTVNSNPSLYKERIILVDNVLVSLQQMARYHRLGYRIPVIAITGTNGKTTTKELITAVLSTKYRVVATKGNLNNHIGVPLTLLGIDSNTEVAVIEMGASAPGEIKMLAEIVCPSFGLITNVGKAHLLGFGSFEGVKRTKGELYENLQEHKRIAFVNVDNENLLGMLNSYPNLHIVPYGVRNNCAKIVEEEGNPYLNMVITNPDVKDASGYVKNGFGTTEIEVRSKLIGSYNADNVMAALCVASYFNVSAKEAVKAIEDYVPSNNRSQLTRTGRNLLIVDAYNANPTSMRASIENFSRLQFPHKVLILGDMLELGADSVAEHRKILEFALSVKAEKIYMVGEEFRKAAEMVKESGDIAGEMDGKTEFFADSKLLKEFFEKNPPLEKTFLIKGSRGTRLEIIIETL